MIAWTVGGAARNLLQQDGAAALLGQTSRGAFLVLASGAPLFLSLESFRGPLTVNISGEVQRLKALPARAAARIHAQAIVFEQYGLSIRTAPAPTWFAPPRSGEALPPPELAARLQEVRRQALRIASPDGMFLLLAASRGDAAPDAGEHTLLSAIRTIETRLSFRRAEPLAAALLPFLGCGRGLTPSGDDLVLGLLLALNRWGDLLSPDLDVPSLNQLVLPAAAQRTTALSAALIACAAQGQADERLVAALDGLLCGGAAAGALVAGIAGWGNTSGLDALAGMLLASAS